MVCKQYIVLNHTFLRQGSNLKPVTFPRGQIVRTCKLSELKILTFVVTFVTMLFQEDATFNFFYQIFRSIIPTQVFLLQGSISILEYEQAVWDQWLVCDLRELSYAYLPAGLSEQPKIELNHVYFLQVNVTIPFSCALRSMQGMNHPLRISNLQRLIHAVHPCRTSIFQVIWWARQYLSKLNASNISDAGFQCELFFKINGTAHPQFCHPP